MSNKSASNTRASILPNLPNIATQEIATRLNSFKSSLKTQASAAIVQRHILSGTCYIVDDHGYFKIRQRIAEKYAIHPNAIVMVGSAKLGFSIKPSRRYGHFGEQSDIDLAIVDDKLFDQVWKAVNGYALEKRYWPQQNEFCNSLLAGWIRPDLLPPSSHFKFCNEWWTFFNALSAEKLIGPFPVRAGLYRDIQFLQSYQEICVKQCQEESDSTP